MLIFAVASNHAVTIDFQGRPLFSDRVDRLNRPNIQEQLGRVIKGQDVYAYEEDILTLEAYAPDVLLLAHWEIVRIGALVKALDVLKIIESAS